MRRGPFGAKSKDIKFRSTHVDAQEKALRTSVQLRPGPLEQEEGGLKSRLLLAFLLRIPAVALRAGRVQADQVPGPGNLSGLLHVGEQLLDRHQGPPMGYLPGIRLEKYELLMAVQKSRTERE